MLMQKKWKQDSLFDSDFDLMHNKSNNTLFDFDFDLMHKKSKNNRLTLTLT